LVRKESSNNKDADAKSRKRTIIIVVGLVILASIILGCMVNLYLERGREQEEHDKAFLSMEYEIWSWQVKQEQAAIASYEEYIKDNETMDAFYILRGINPFLKKQMPYLRDYMKILHDNITLENYGTAYNQFILCYTMDKSYSENYSFYFQQIEEKYENMMYIRHDSVPYINRMVDYYWEGCYLFAIESDYDSSHSDGFELEYYTDELEYYEEQINYMYDTFIS
jgi:hypothetical protein